MSAVHIIFTVIVKVIIIDDSPIYNALPVGDSLVPGGGDSLAPVGVITETKAQKNAQ